VLIGSFQAARFYRQSQRRWLELARTARVALALADFDRLERRPEAPIEVPIGREHPLAREWAIVFDAPGACACMAGWEIPAVQALPDRSRRFEVLWSPEPEVVHAAALVAAELIATLAPAVADPLAALLDRPAEPTAPQLRAAAALAHRMLGYLASTLEAR
jgi:DICT domain-containing protein